MKDVIILIRCREAPEAFELEMKVEGDPAPSTMEVLGIMEMAKLQWAGEKSLGPMTPRPEDEHGNWVDEPPHVQ